MEGTQLESTLDDVVQATQLDPESFLSPTREASQSLEQDAMALSSPRGKAPVAAETSTPARPGNGGALRNALVEPSQSSPATTVPANFRTSQRKASPSAPEYTPVSNLREHSH